MGVKLDFRKMFFTAQPRCIRIWQKTKMAFLCCPLTLYIDVSRVPGDKWSYYKDQIAHLEMHVLPHRMEVIHIILYWYIEAERNMVAIFQAIFLIWFHWIQFLSYLSNLIEVFPITQHWFRYWFGPLITWSNDGMGRNTHKLFCHKKCEPSGTTKLRNLSIFFCIGDRVNNIHSAPLMRKARVLKNL